MQQSWKRTLLVYSLATVSAVVLAALLLNVALAFLPMNQPSTFSPFAARDNAAQPEGEAAAALLAATHTPTRQPVRTPTITPPPASAEASTSRAVASLPTTAHERVSSPKTTPVPTTPEVATALPATATPLPPEPTAPQGFTYVFPVRGACQYGPDHHDYPATDIFCPTGSEVIAPTAGVVDFVNQIDRWDPATDVPADRGGIMFAIIGDDGVRYYGSHLQELVPDLAPGMRVATGQLLGKLGNSGNARTTPPHLHFGISRPTTPDDWETRRGEISPYPYLQAWERGEMLTPVLPVAQPAPPTQPAPPAAPPVVATSLEQELTPLFAQTNGTFGAIVYDVSTQSVVYRYNADLVFSSASLIKIPIAMTVYHLANQGSISLDEQIVLRAEVIVGGSGSIQYAAPGTAYTVRELCARMIYDSDNTAANMLIDRIGGFEPVNQVMAQVQAGQTRLQRRMMDMQAQAAGYDNLTSPADMFLLLKTLNDGTLLGSAGSQAIIGFMQQTASREKLPAYLPAGVVVAHKVGTLPGVEHDAGIVWLPDGRQYVVVLMSADLASNATGIAVLAEASRIIYSYEQQLAVPPQ